MVQLHLALVMAGSPCPSLTELSSVLVCLGINSPLLWRNFYHCSCSINTAFPHTVSTSILGPGFPLIIITVMGKAEIRHQSIWKYLEILMSQLLSPSQRYSEQAKDIFQSEINLFCAQFFRVSWRDLENLLLIPRRTN